MAPTNAHSHGATNYGRAFTLGVILNTGVVIRMSSRDMKHSDT
jgi:hypothetical protein